MDPSSAADWLRHLGHFLDFSAGSGFHFSVPGGLYIELLQEVKPWMQSIQPAHAEQRYYSSPSRLWPQEGLSVAFTPATVNYVGLCAWASVFPFSSPPPSRCCGSTFCCRFVCPCLGYHPPCVLFEGRAWVCLVLYHSGTRGIRKCLGWWWMNIILNGTAVWAWALPSFVNW